MEWEQKFLLVIVRALQRGISNHTPLLMNSGEAAHVDNKAAFSFELSWFERECFYDLVAAEWVEETRGASYVDRWQNKISHLRQFLRGWDKSLSGVYRKTKERLLSLIDTLDIKTETVPFYSAECAAKREADECLAKLMREEEIKWSHRAKVRHVQEGDNNMKYFHLITNGKHQKKKNLLVGTG